MEIRLDGCLEECTSRHVTTPASGIFLERYVLGRNPAGIRIKTECFDIWQAGGNGGNLCCYRDRISKGSSAQNFGHRWASTSALMSAISDIDISYSDMGTKNVGINPFIPISE